MQSRHDRRGYADRDRDPPDGGYGRQPGYAPEPARVQTPNWRWWIPAEGISRDVIQADIQRYLGPEALVRPGEGTEQYAGVPGYWIAAYRTLTASMIQDLKADSANWQRERGQSGARYEDSRVRESRQYWGPSEDRAGGGGRAEQSTYSPAPAQAYNQEAQAYQRPQVYAQPAQGRTGYGQPVQQQPQPQTASTENYAYHQQGSAYQPAYSTQADSRATPRSENPQAQYQAMYGQQAQPNPPNYGQASARTARPGYYIASDGNEYPLSALQR